MRILPLAVCFILLVIGAEGQGLFDVLEFDNPHYEYEVSEGEVTSEGAYGARRRKSSETQALPSFPKENHTLCVTSEANGFLCPKYNTMTRDLPGLGKNGSLNYLWVSDTRAEFGVFNATFREKTLTFVGVLKGYKTMRQLHLYKLDLRDIEHSAFASMTKLELLDLRANNLTELTNETFTGLGHLKNLAVAGNEIFTIETGAFAIMSELGELHLSWNRLNILHWDTYAILPKLKSLAMNNNNISKFIGIRYEPTKTGKDIADTNIKEDPRIPYVLTELKNLHLASNKLTEIGDNDLSRVSNLKQLDLSQNQITFFGKQALTSLHNICVFNISNNQLKLLHPEWFTALTAAVADGTQVEVDLSGNYWHCDCAMIPYVKYIQELRLRKDIPEKYIQSLEITCSTPESFSGKRLDNETGLPIVNQCKEEEKKPPMVHQGKKNGEPVIFAIQASQEVWDLVKIVVPCVITILGIWGLAYILRPQQPTMIVPDPTGTFRNTSIGAVPNKCPILNINKHLPPDEDEQGNEHRREPGKHREPARGPDAAVKKEEIGKENPQAGGDDREIAGMHPRQRIDRRRSVN